MAFKKSLLVLSLCFGVIGLSSCSTFTEGQVDFDKKTHEIYQLAVESGFEGSYEEWLESIRGPKGDDGTSIVEIIDTGIKNGKATYDVVFSDGSISPLEITLPKDGTSILSIEKTGTEGLVDTYTIKFSDGRTSKFTVTNGEKGEQGIQGVPGQDGKTPTVEISPDGFWVINDKKTTIKAQGPKGEDGISISKIEKTKTEGLVDTYTITYSDGHTSEFTVTNGEQGIQGVPGEDGKTPTVEISDDGFWLINGIKSEIRAQGPKGEDGVSITKIEKTDTQGLIDIYTITYSDGHTSMFTVTNGAKGDQGIQGVPGKDGKTPKIGVNSDGYWVVDDVSTGIRAQGPKGEDGISIVSVKKTKTEGLVDTYTITYSDGKTSEFTVTNGEKGEQGIQGIPGKDGKTPTVEISDDGYWIINGNNSGIKAQGPKGEDGISIVSVKKTKTEGLVDTYTITYSDGNTSLFTVTNGDKGEQGIQGIPGKDGKTPTVEISEDGYWVINGQKQAIKVQGPKGDAGRSAYEIYLDTYPEEKSKYPTEKAWIEALVNGELAKKNTFTVSFMVDGNIKFSQTVKKGDNAIRPESPSKSGHQFVGWYLGDVEWVFEGYVVTKSITLTAKFVTLDSYKDYNEDGLVNELDVEYYSNYQKWKRDPNKATDINGDSFIDLVDYKAFLQMDSWLASDLAVDYNKDLKIDEKDYFIHVESTEWINSESSYDLNDDRKINYADYVLSKEYDYQEFVKWVRSPAAEDVNKDGKITKKDYDILMMQGTYKIYNYKCKDELYLYITGTRVLIKNLGMYLTNSTFNLTQNSIEATLDPALIKALGDKASAIQEALDGAQVQITSKNTFNIVITTSINNQPFAFNLSFAKDTEIGGYKTTYKYTDGNKSVEVSFNVKKS